MIRNWLAGALTLLSILSADASSVPKEYIHKVALRGGFTTNIAPSAPAWQPIKIGTGGILTGINIAPDGTKVSRTDSFGGYLWPVGGTQWVQLATGARFPAGTTNLGDGFEEIQLDPSNSQNIWLTWNGMLFKSTNQGTTITQVTSFTTQPAPYANDNNPTKRFGPYIAIDPNNSNVVYVSTPSQGLYKTTDGGVTMNPVTAVSAGLPGNQGSSTTPSYGTDTTSLTIGTGSKVFSHNSSSFGFPVSTTNFVQVWDTANPANQMFGYVTANSGTSLTLNVVSTQGSGTFSTWTIGPAVKNNAGTVSIGGGHRIAFDNSGAHNCGAGSNQTCNIFVHTYHVGTWKSTDGGTTWSPVTATGAPTSIDRWAIDPFGVLWVVTDDWTGNTNIAKYDGTTWTNPITAAGCCGLTQFSAVAVDSSNSASKSTTHVTFVEQGGAPQYSYTANGGSTWNQVPGLGSGTNNSFTSLTGDVTWLSNWYTAVNPNGYFAGNDLAYDPLNSGRLYIAAEGAWYFNPSTSATTNTYTQQSIGIEEFIATRVNVPSAGSLFLQNWDYPCFATATFTAYPSVATCNMNSVSNLVIGYGYDWLWSNQAEAAATNQDSSGGNSSSRNISGSTMTAGGNGTWTNFPTQPCASVGQSGSEVAITAHLKYFVTCIGTIPKVTTDGGTNWAPISITGGTPSSGWGQFSAFQPFSRTMATDHTNGDVYIYNTNTGSGSDQIYKYTASGGTWAGQGSPSFPTAYIVEQLKTVYGQTGHLMFTPDVSGSTGYFSSNGGASWGTFPGFGQVTTMGSGAAFSGNYSSIYVLGYYTGTVNLETGGTQAVTNQYWTYMCKNFQTSTRLCSGNWTQIGSTQYAGDMLTSVVDIEGDPVTPGLLYSYGHGGAFWGQFN